MIFSWSYSEYSSYTWWHAIWNKLVTSSNIFQLFCLLIFNKVSILNSKKSPACLIAKSCFLSAVKMHKVAVIFHEKAEELFGCEKQGKSRTRTIGSAFIWSITNNLARFQTAKNISCLLQSNSLFRKSSMLILISMMLKMALKTNMYLVWVNKTEKHK